MLLDGQLGLPQEGSERLIAEMLGVRLEMASNGKLKTVDPRPSPDYFDALLCALHARQQTEEPHVWCGQVWGA